MDKYEIMIAKKTAVHAEFEARQNIHISIMRSADNANQKLDGLVNDFRHYLNDQLIDLKYGPGYKASFLDEILLQVSRL